MVQTFRLRLERYLDLSDRRRTLERLSEELLGEDPGYRPLCPRLGVSHVVGRSVLAESGDLRRFRHHRQYLKAWGFTLCTV